MRRCPRTLADVIPSLDDLHARGARQQPTWPDRGEVDAVVARLRTMPPLVFAGECDNLRAQLAAVARGEAFLLQGGDCAETFDSVTADNVRNKLQVLLSMAVVLTYAAAVPVVKVGRIAGQYAKPRSADLETRDGVTLPAYRGDAVNGFEFTEESRRPDPRRLLDVYHASAATLNLTRAFVTGGYADLRQVHAWNTDFVRTSPAGKRYEMVAGEIDRALAFMSACGIDPDEFSSVDFFSSHEALLLEYEHALTRIDSRTQLPYDVSGHLVWIGERTRQLDVGAVELPGALTDPQEVAGDVVGQPGPGVQPGHGLLVVAEERLVGGEEVHRPERVGAHAAGVHERQRAVDLAGDRLVPLAHGAVAHEVGVPRVHLTQVGVTTGHEGAGEVQGGGRGVVDVEQPPRVRSARGLVEGGPVDGVAAIRRQGHALTRLVVG